MRRLPGRFLDSGGVYKLAFGPKAFIVVSDPIVVRHLLKARASVFIFTSQDSIIMGGRGKQAPRFKHHTH